MFASLSTAAKPAGGLKEKAAATMKKAAAYYRANVAVNGGYVYYTSLDLKTRLGEGKAGPTQIWVQPPGTPTVGLAYVAAYEAVGDELYRDAARETAAALMYGQLKSGGWANMIDFDPKSKAAGLYRNGRGKGRNASTFDDGATQAAVLFLARLDKALGFKDTEIHQAAAAAVDAVLAAQFPNGAFPQVFTGPSAKPPVVPAVYPDYDWRTENRIKNYWDLYTLNDDAAGSISEMLLGVYSITGDERCLNAAGKLGDFLVLARMPEPQPAWAQQYDEKMRPVWARKFEPPAVSGRESQDAVETLLKIHAWTNDDKYLKPIPAALAYLRRSKLSDGRLARFYELKSNKPLYMTSDYVLTYDDG
ncbi:MAG: pectate lyase, partial [Planctomycetia bacterium]